MRAANSALALLLLGLLLLQVPSCGGSNAAIQTLPTLQGNGEQVAATDGFVLGRHSQYVKNGKLATLSMTVSRDGTGTVVEVTADGNDLREVFLSLQYDATRIHPVEGAGQAWRAGEETLSLLVLNQPGAVHFGAMLPRPQERMGISGPIDLMRVRFAAGRVNPRSASTAPTSSFSVVPNLTLNEATGEINFSYYNQGDYDQNTEVNISDLSPLGAHFGETQAGGFDPATALSVIDGDDNGELNISDLTPIGANYFANISGWNAYAGAAADFPTSASDDNGAAVDIDTFDTSHLSPDDGTSRRTVTFTTASTAFAGLEQFWVRPAGSNGEGIASDPFLLGIDVTPPVWTDSANPGILAVAPHDGSVTVYWGEATDTQSSPVEYAIYYAEGNTLDFMGPAELVNPSQPFEGYEFHQMDGLTNGQEYTFAVRAHDSSPAMNEEQNTVMITVTPEASQAMPPGITGDALFDGHTVQTGTTTVDGNGCITVQGDLTIDGTILGQDSSLCFEVFGDLFVNGTVTVDGDDADRPDNSEWQDIKFICHGDYFFANTSVVGGEANVYIVDDPASIIPTQDIYDDSATDANPGDYAANLMPESTGGSSRIRSSAAVHTASAPPFAVRGFVSGDWGTVPTPPKGVKRVVLAIYAKNGKLTFSDFSITGPKGHKGDNDIDICNATGGPGYDAFTCRIQAAGKLKFSDVTINLGDGGDGGDAFAGPCCPIATAKGGNGGKSGNFRATSGTEIEIFGTFTLNPGKGGKGGDAFAIGMFGDSGCPCFDGCNALATGGNGAAEAKTANVRGNVNGIANFVLGPVLGGDGGLGDATGGKGGDCTCCPAGKGCNGGVATGMGGKGGNATFTNTGAVIGGGATGGDGGQGTAVGGDGGDGADCDKFTQGGDGGVGGDASATGGDGGVAAGDGPLTDGTQGPADATGGAGGNGGDGCFNGGGGAGGIATADGVPQSEVDGTPGSPGLLHCPIFFCIPPTELVPDPGTSGPVPDAFSGTAGIYDDTMTQVGTIPFTWVVPPFTQVLWDVATQSLTFNAQSSPVNRPQLRMNYSNVNWQIPQPNVVGWETAFFGASGPSATTGLMEMLDGADGQISSQGVSTIPPNAEGIPVDFLPPTFGGVTFRLSASPLCTLVVKIVCIIDP